MGDVRFFNVRQANLMVSRMALLARLAWARFIVFFLEQPLSSIMERHRRLTEGPFAHLWCIITWMGIAGYSWCLESRLPSAPLFCVGLCCFCVFCCS